MKDLEKDKGFQISLEAEKEFLMLRDGAAGIPACPTDAAEKRRWQSRFGGPVAEIRRRAAAMKKKFGDTWHTQQAEAIVSELSG